MIDLQETILETLYKYYDTHRGSPKMLFTDLCDELFDNPSQIQVIKVQGELHILKKKAWIEYDLTTSGRAGLAWLEPEGIRVAQKLRRPEILKPIDSQVKCVEENTEDVKRPEITSASSSEIYPITLEDLARTDQDCARLIQRDELLREIKDHLIQTSDRLTVVYGQPLVGKTKLLERLVETLSDEYVPLMVTGQGLDTLGLDAFAFDLADQLTNKFKKWARQHRVSFTLNVPRWTDFGQGNGRRAFHIHWNHLREMAGQRQLVVICDEIERLLDYPEKLDPRIPTFLGEFIRSLESGYFILAASERIRFSSNKEISMLVAEGRVIRIPYYDERAALLIFSALRKYIIYEDGTLQYCVTLCDGHPRLLRAVFEAIVSQAAGPQSRRKSAKSAIEPIEETVIERASDSLWALCHDLSADERFVVWLISRKVSSPIKGLVYSLGELVSLENQHFRQPTVDLVKGIEHLEHREWVEWKNREKGVFRFKLGIFPLWVQRHCIGINPTTMEFIYH